MTTPGGKCPNPAADLSPHLRDVLALFRLCDSQFRLSMDGPVAYDFGAIRGVARDVGFDTAGEVDFDDGSTFWPLVRMLCDVRIEVLKEGRTRAREYERLEATRGKPRAE